MSLYLLEFWHLLISTISISWKMFYNKRHPPPPHSPHAQSKGQASVLENNRFETITGRLMGINLICLCLLECGIPLDSFQPVLQHSRSVLPGQSSKRLLVIGRSLLNWTNTCMDHWIVNRWPIQNGLFTKNRFLCVNHDLISYQDLSIRDLVQ